MYLEDYVMCGIIGLVSLLAALVLFVYMPAGLSAQARCLESGYPKAEVTWHLKKYCMNLDGSVTVRVDQIE